MTSEKHLPPSITMIPSTILLVQDINGGAIYSYAMCYWEEQHWIRTKSVHAAEFFHGTLEIVDRDTPVTVYICEDKERPLAERVAKFLPRVCANYSSEE